MARRRRKKEELDPLQAFLLLLMIGAGWGAYKLTSSLIAVGIAIGIVIASYVFIIVIINQKHVERLKRSGIADIDKMEGRQFEKYLGHLFKAHGYDVRVTQAAGDFGADLVIVKDGKRIVVQAKRYSKNVGIKAVQEAQASIAHYSASAAWVISNSGYTEAAISLAKSNHVRLIDRLELIEMILKLNPGADAPTPKQIVEEAVFEDEDMECTRCGGFMVRRKSSRGEFYGCSSFPRCRNTHIVE